MKKLTFLLLFASLLFSDKVDRTLSYKTYESINAVQSLLLQNKTSTAIKKLETLYKKIDNNRVKKYEKAFVSRMFAYAYISNEDYDNALIYLKEAYDYNLFISKEQHIILKNLAQISMAKSNFKKAIEYYQEYLKYLNKKDSKIYMELASAYSENNEIKNAIKYVDKAIKNSKKPKQNWYEMLLALYYSQDDYEMSIVIQEQLIQKFGIKKDYLFRLCALYQYVENSSKALSTLELAYDMGYFTKKEEYIRLGSMLLNEELPQKSSSVIEAGLESDLFEKDIALLKILAGSYERAKNYKKALLTYEELAKLSDDGNIYAKVAQHYTELDDFKNAVKNFQKAIKSQSIKNIGDVYLLMGISYYELRDKKNAKKAFMEALKYDKTEKNAKQWLEYL